MSATAIACAVIGVALLGAGAPKLLRTPRYRERVRHWRLPVTALPVIGAVEASAGGLLLAGAFTPSTVPALAGAGLAATTMMGAVATHVRIGDPPRAALPAAVLGALSAACLVASAAI